MIDLYLGWVSGFSFLLASCSCEVGRPKDICFLPGHNLIHNITSMLGSKMYVCLCHDVFEIRGQLHGIGSLLQSFYGFQRLNLSWHLQLSYLPKFVLFLYTVGIFFFPRMLPLFKKLFFILCALGFCLLVCLCESVGSPVVGVTNSCNI